MPRTIRRRRRKRVPASKTAEKLAIWNRYREPVAFKFYTTIEPTKGAPLEHGEFSVVESLRMNRRALFFLVKSTIRRMIQDNEVPPDINYKTYDKFVRLYGERWRRVYKIRDYNVQHTRT